MNQNKEIQNSAQTTEKEFTEIYQSKVASLENDRKRYRKQAQDLVEKKQKLRKPEWKAQS